MTRTLSTTLRLLRSTSRIICVAGACATAACGTTALRDRGPGAAGMVLHTFVSEQGAGCTTTGVTDATSPEAFLPELLAPLLGGVIKSTLGGLGSAIQAASEEKTKTWTTPASPVFVAHFNYTRGTPPAPPSFSTSYQQFCITVLAVDVSPGAGPRDSAATASPVSGAASRKSEIESYIRSALGDNWRNNFSAIRFYAEIEVTLDASSALNQVYYEAQPTYAYLAQPLTGNGYKLAAVKVDLGSVFEANKAVWTHTFSLIDNPMLPGDLRTLSDNPIPGSGLLPLPPLATTEISAMKSMQDAITALKTTFGAEPHALTEAQIQELAPLRQAVVKAQRDVEDAKCDADAGKDAEKAQRCRNALTAARAYGDKAAPWLLDLQRADLNRTIVGLRGDQNKVPVDPYNVSVSLTETRDANALGLAVAKILSDAKPATDQAITSHVNGQLGVTPDMSKTPAANAYRLARFDYDQALIAYDAAKAKGDPSNTAIKQRALIDKYNDLLLKAESLGVQVPVPSPY